MSVPSSSRVRFEEVRFVYWDDILGVYSIVGALFAHPMRMIKIINSTNVGIFISYDGVTDQDIIASNSTDIYNFCSNRSSVSGILEMPLGAGFFVRFDDAPTEGFVAAICLYASDR
jgi:hypothetical protein